MPVRAFTSPESDLLRRVKQVILGRSHVRGCTCMARGREEMRLPTRIGTSWFSFLALSIGAASSDCETSSSILNWCWTVVPSSARSSTAKTSGGRPSTERCRSIKSVEREGIEI